MLCCANNAIYPLNVYSANVYLRVEMDEARHAFPPLTVRPLPLLLLLRAVFPSPAHSHFSLMLSTQHLSPVTDAENTFLDARHAEVWGEKNNLHTVVLLLLLFRRQKKNSLIVRDNNSG